MKTFIIILMFGSISSFATSYICFHTSRSSHIKIINTENLDESFVFISGFGYSKSRYEKPFRTKLDGNRLILEYKGDTSYWGDEESELKITFRGEHNEDPKQLIELGKSLYASFEFKDDQYYGTSLIENKFCAKDY